MVKLLHLSESRNKQSIMRHGLVPTKCRYKHHLRSFNKREKIIGDKILYTWLDNDYTSKLAKDMIYCKIFLHAREDYFRLDENYGKINFKKFHTKPCVPYDVRYYDLYEIDWVTEIGLDYHIQSPSDNPYSSLYGFEDKYAHDGFMKQLMVFDVPLRPKRIVGTLKYSYDKGKINIKFIK